MRKIVLVWRIRVTISTSTYHAPLHNHHAAPFIFFFHTNIRYYILWKYTLNPLYKCRFYRGTITAGIYLKPEEILYLDSGGEHFLPIR